MPKVELKEKGRKEMAEQRDRVAVVTGAASGIGEAITRRLFEEGASVVLADTDESGGTALAKELDPTGRRSLFAAL